jgi:UPF0176 protein
MIAPKENAAGPIVVAAFYKFVPLPRFEEYRPVLQEAAERAEVKGTLLLAPEGINGTVAGVRDGVHSVLTSIRKLPGCCDLEWKESCAKTMPFKRMKVRLKREIVTMGVRGIDPNRTVGAYVSPQDWNELIDRPDIVVVDTRNDYEVAIGSFEDAVNPNTQSFSDFPDWAKEAFQADPVPAVAMFCTGGIRCEKATALLKEMGVKEVYHLKGGILKYLEEVPADESRWRGECFVFDERVSVGHGLVPGPYQLCSICRRPFLSGKTQGGYASKPCPDCEKAADDEKKEAAAERQRQVELAERRGHSHFGPKRK